MVSYLAFSMRTPCLFESGRKVRKGSTTAMSTCLFVEVGILARVQCQYVSRWILENPKPAHSGDFGFLVEHLAAKLFYVLQVGFDVIAVNIDQHLSRQDCRR